MANMPLGRTYIGNRLHHVILRLQGTAYLTPYVCEPPRNRSAMLNCALITCSAVSIRIISFLKIIV